MRPSSFSFSSQMKQMFYFMFQSLFSSRNPNCFVPVQSFSPYSLLDNYNHSYAALSNTVIVMAQVWVGPVAHLELLFWLFFSTPQYLIGYDVTSSWPYRRNSIERKLKVSTKILQFVKEQCFQLGSPASQKHIFPQTCWSSMGSSMTLNIFRK